MQTKVTFLQPDNKSRYEIPLRAALHAFTRGFGSARRITQAAPSPKLRLRREGRYSTLSVIYDVAPPLRMTRYNIIGV